jgi:hypothetical protein
MSKLENEVWALNPKLYKQKHIKEFGLQEPYPKKLDNKKADEKIQGLRWILQATNLN